VPYLTFSLIYVPLRIVASGMANSDFDGGYWRILIGISPNGGVWFLYTLFIFFFITFYLVKPKNVKIVLIFAFAISIISQLGLPLFETIHNTVPRLLDLCRFYIYFLLGLQMRKYLDSDGRKKENWLMSYGIPKFIIFIVCFILYDVFTCNILAVPLALLGVNLTIILSSYLQNKKILAYFGVISMDIYLLHGPLMVVLRWIFIRFGVSKLIVTVGLFFGSTLIAVVISRCVIHKFKIIEFLCTGSSKREEF
jgi:peptidoglycan/LPS O-acetylase OafA/YrhL